MDSDDYMARLKIEAERRGDSAELVADGRMEVLWVIPRLVVMKALVAAQTSVEDADG